MGLPKPPKCKYEYLVFASGRNCNPGSRRLYRLGVSLFERAKDSGDECPRFIPCAPNIPSSPDTQFSFRAPPPASRCGISSPPHCRVGPVCCTVTSAAAVLYGEGVYPERLIFKKRYFNFTRLCFFYLGSAGARYSRRLGLNGTICWPITSRWPINVGLLFDGLAAPATAPEERSWLGKHITLTRSVTKLIFEITNSYGFGRRNTSRGFYQFTYVQTKFEFS